MEHKIKVGITQGDINGVGYEVILKTLSDPHIVELCTPVVYGSAKVAAYHRKALDIPAVNFNIISDASAADENKVNLITCVDDDVKVEIGKATAIGGEAAYAALERAAADMEAGSIDVLLTAPINKHAIQSDKFDFPGHTEYLERRLGNGQKALMILLNDTLRVALVSGHVPVSKVSSVVTKETILEKLQIFEQSLRQDFCVVKPRIAVLALNPHAGDDGLLGTEEIEIIKPAIHLYRYRTSGRAPPYLRFYRNTVSLTETLLFLYKKNDYGIHLSPNKERDGTTARRLGSVRLCRMPYHDREKYELPVIRPYNSPRLPSLSP